MEFVKSTAESRLLNPGIFPWSYINLNEKDLEKLILPTQNYFYYRKNTKWIQGYSDPPRISILKPEIYAWFQENLGPEYYEYWEIIDRIYYSDNGVNDIPKIMIEEYSKNWRKIYGFIPDDRKKWWFDNKPSSSHNMRIFFKEESDATLFKITWGGR
jgi:hypothetical protein